MNRKQVGIFVLAIVFLFITVFWIESLKIRNNKVGGKTSPSEASLGLDKEDKYTGWKSYGTNSFEIMYPSTWEARHEGSDIFIGSTEKEAVYLRISSKTVSYSDWIGSKKNNPESPYSRVLSEESYALGSISGYKVVSSTDVGLNEQSIVVPSGENLVIFSFLQTTEEMNEIFNRIIESLIIS